MLGRVGAPAFVGRVKPAFFFELDGEEVLPQLGDIVVQNGTRHRWHNRGPGPAKWAAVVIGARHDLVRKT